jgi:homoserine dehydrogenase
MKEIGVGLLGLGTIGAGVAHVLPKNVNLLASRLGVRPALRRAADIFAERRAAVPAGVLTTDDAASVVDADDVDIVVELIGGTGVARELVMRALCRGKPVVTANKALLAAHGAELFQLARENGTEIYFEASVGGGIPVIRALQEGLVADNILRIYGILNGTCNFILTGMEETGQSFEQALQAAQAAGYAEANPALDIDGQDTAHKAVILASLVYGQHFPLEAVPVEGIRGLAELDMAYARELGYCIRLLAVIEDAGSEIEVRVHPALVPSSHILASVKGVFNAMLIESDGAGELLLYGRGAGREPTASAVVSNVADAAMALASAAVRRPSIGTMSAARRLRDINQTEVRYYLRLNLLDRPGVFGEIATILGRHGISIASLLQKESCAGEQVPVVIITQTAPERAFKDALAEINALPIVGENSVRLRIMGEI